MPYEAEYWYALSYEQNFWKTPFCRYYPNSFKYKFEFTNL